MPALRPLLIVPLMTPLLELIGHGRWAGPLAE